MHDVTCCDFPVTKTEFKYETTHVRKRQIMCFYYTQTTKITTIIVIYSFAKQIKSTQSLYFIVILVIMKNTTVLCLVLLSRKIGFYVWK